MSAAEKILAASLAGVTVFLLLVGAVSSTPLRHALQATPAALALLSAARRKNWAAYAAFPIFLFWLLIMLAIWLFLFGLAKLVTGHFTAVEVALTVLIGVSCATGIAAARRSRPAAALSARLIALGIFAALQIGTMWVSLQPMFATR